MLTQEASFNVESPHKDTSCLGMTTAGYRNQNEMAIVNIQLPTSKQILHSGIAKVQRSVVIVSVGDKARI